MLIISLNFSAQYIKAILLKASIGNRVRFTALQPNPGCSSAEFHLLNLADINHVKLVLKVYCNASEPKRPISLINAI